MADRVMAGTITAASGLAAQADLLTACLLAADSPAQAWGRLLCRLAGTNPPAAGAAGPLT